MSEPRYDFDPPAVPEPPKDEPQQRSPDVQAAMDRMIAQLTARRDADAELRRLSEAATPGPWTADAGNLWSQNDVLALFYGKDEEDCTNADANAAFIVAAVNAVRERMK